MPTLAGALPLKRSLPLALLACCAAAASAAAQAAAPAPAPLRAEPLRAVVEALAHDSRAGRGTPATADPPLPTFVRYGNELSAL